MPCGGFAVVCVWCLAPSYALRRKLAIWKWQLAHFWALCELILYENVHPWSEITAIYLLAFFTSASFSALNILLFPAHFSVMHIWLHWVVQILRHTHCTIPNSVVNEVVALPIPCVYLVKILSHFTTVRFPHELHGTRLLPFVLSVERYAGQHQRTESHLERTTYGHIEYQ